MPERIGRETMVRAAVHSTRITFYGESTLRVREDVRSQPQGGRQTVPFCVRVFAAVSLLPTLSCEAGRLVSAVAQMGILLVGH
jgi:hypothetical protein